MRGISESGADWFYEFNRMNFPVSTISGPGRALPFRHFVGPESAVRTFERKDMLNSTKQQLEGTLHKEKGASKQEARDL
jgi:hypothetical protein